ncbi:MAG TPA: cytochrome c biogenesis protein ResB, partial [Desulfobacterales bacterium]|nr:cytochrome c biogenesis protein ResB [Desulfobacterales bacterium]
MTTKTSAERPNVVWRTLSSVKLTIALLIILALASVLGTFIPQGQGAAMEFAKGLSPTTMKILTSLDLFDIYHATWFRVIIVLLALNLIVCS